jgi:hypothetical protein
MEVYDVKLDEKSVQVGVDGFGGRVIVCRGDSCVPVSVKGASKEAVLVGARDAVLAALEKTPLEQLTDEARTPERTASA